MFWEPIRPYNCRMQSVLFLVSFLLSSFAAIDKFFAEYAFVFVVLAVHPVIMLNWTLWFLRTLRELKS